MTALFIRYIYDSVTHKQGFWSQWDFILRFKVSVTFTLKGKWLSESRGPSNSTTGPDWSPDISCIVASKDSPAEPSGGWRTLARVSKALIKHKKVTLKYPRFHLDTETGREHYRKRQYNSKHWTRPSTYATFLIE